jgi:hypothetical protein
MTQVLQIHKCKQLEEYMSKPFNMAVEIIEDTLWIHDLFTPSTPKEYQKEHENCYELDVNYCPFCGIQINRG